MSEPAFYIDEDSDLICVLDDEKYKLADGGDIGEGSTGLTFETAPELCSFYKTDKITGPLIELARSWYDARVNNKPWPPGVTAGNAFDLQADRELVDKASQKELPDDGPGLDLHDDHMTLAGKDLDLKRLSADELRVFISNYLGGVIYTSADIRDKNLTGQVFLPVLFGAFAGYKPGALEDIGVLWEFMNQALPRAIIHLRAIYGHPMFPSCRMLHKLDWARARKAINRELKRQKELELPSDDDPEEI